MNDHDALAWMGRKVGWGFSAGQRDSWDALGVDAVLDQLVNPDDYGIEVRPDPFENVLFEENNQQGAIAQASANWLELAVQSPRPLETFMDLFWHDYFAVSAGSITPLLPMLGHMSLLAQHGLGNFRTLLREVAIDAAMLLFLDNAQSRKGNPNENFARELLELYSVGVGAFDENDVKAAAISLTGWEVSSAEVIVRPEDVVVTFNPGRHDPTPQRLLGAGAVKDLDTTIDAILGERATALRVVSKLTAAILGPGHKPRLTRHLAKSFSRDWEIRPVVRGLLELAVRGAASPTMLEPIAWYVSARRLPTPAPSTEARQTFFREAGQEVLFPPTVGGFPPNESYLSTSATIARFNLASHLAQQPVDVAANDTAELTQDLDALAAQIGLIRGFSDATSAAASSVEPGPDRMAIVLSSPDLLVVEP